MDRQRLIESAEIAIGKNDFEKARKLLLPLAELGEHEAQFLLGYLYFTDAEVPYLEAVSWLRKAADQGNFMACYYLSKEVDDSECLSISERNSYLRKSAELGYVNAQRDLGCAYATATHGFKKDEKEAREWYRKASEQGHSDAQYNLGIMFLKGEGGKKDTAEGIKWLETSALDKKNGCVEAAKLLSEIYSMGLYSVPKDEVKAKYWRDKE